MSLSLRINIIDNNVTKTIVFDPTTSVHDACKIIREKHNEVTGQSKDYGLFLTDDNKTGVWLEPGRHLEYYLLRNGDVLEYRKKLRTLRVKMLDGSVKTMLVDDSQIIANMMVVICTKLGITNHDEYSLVIEDLENQENINDNKNYGTLTLKRNKERNERERDTKMETLRRKIKTEDEVNWLDPSKTLREQGIDENETVLLKRKYFFSDQNIDSRDPVQLNLLYVQARDTILNGTHPITQDKACEFAGIQCQIQFGDYQESKHKTGFLDLKEFLPQSYMKIKGIEKKVFAEHRKNMGLNELDAKVKYTKNARSLTTYGVTFFLVKEKMKGKNKLVPRLLGVTKDSVLRLDERTKEILQTWPLTTVRRWGASPNTFTLDFGDYSDQYYSVQTTEAEQIQQIIAGYIDIILKKKQAKDHLGIEGDEGSTMFEETVNPHKATILQHESGKPGWKINTESVAKPAIMRAGNDGEKTFTMGVMGGAQQTTVSGSVNLGHAPPTLQQTKVTSVLTEPQRALLSTITATHKRITESEYELSHRTEIPELGTDAAAIKWKQVTLNTRKQNINHSIAAMNAATAQVVTLTSGQYEEIDHKAVGAAITTIGSNLPEVTKDVKMIATLMDDGNMGDKLIEATRKLCNAFSDLLKAAEPESREPRQNLLSAASRVGEASTQVLATIGEETVESKELQDMLLSLAKAVANTTAALVLKAKNIASTCEDQQMQNRVIGAATQCALATSQLVACAKVVAPTLQSPACQEQLTAAVREVARAVENLAATCNEATPNQELNNQLKAAAAEVTRTLNDLLNHIKLGTREKAKETVQEDSVEEIFIATDKLSATNDSNEMIKQARRLGQATAQLIQSIKGEAERLPDSDIQRRLLAAAKTLADATAKMVEAARQCATHPQNLAYQNKLRKTAEDLRDVTTYAATTPSLRTKLVEKVHSCAKKAVISAGEAIRAAQISYNHNTNLVTRQALLEDSKELEEQMPYLVETLQDDLQDNNVQSELMYVAEVFLHPAQHFVQSSRNVLPTLSEHTVTETLSMTSHQLHNDLSELRGALSRAKPACQSLGLNAAEEAIKDLQKELGQMERGTLRPLPGDSQEKGVEKMINSSKIINQNVSHLLSATAQGNEMYTSQGARDTVQSLKNLVNSVRAIASTTDNPELKRRLIHSAQEVLRCASELVQEAQKSLQSVNITPGMEKAAKNISKSLESTVNCLPGQKDVDNAITDIITWTSAVDSRSYPNESYKHKSYVELQQELNTVAFNLNEAGAGVISSVRNPVQLASSSKDFSSAFNELLTVTTEISQRQTDQLVKGEMLQCLKNVSTNSTALLTTAKSVSNDPNLPNGKNQLIAVARQLTESLSYLVNVCTSSAPGQSECESAVGKIKATRYLLDNPSEPVNGLSYYETLDEIIEKSKVLGESLTGITSSAKTSDIERFNDNVKQFSGAICNLVESSAQTAYLVGISDPSSFAGRPGLVDQNQFARAKQAIQQGCAVLSSSGSQNYPDNSKHVLEAATLIAKHTSALCNSCRTASNKTNNPVAKRQFVQSAKAVANSTAALVTEIKELDREYTDENRRRCTNATKPLLDAVDNLCIYASSSEFTTIPARISAQARIAQQPIIEAGRRLIDTSSNVIDATKSLIVMNKDPSTWQNFASTSKNVSDSIKTLVGNIRNSAPGQKECDEASNILSNHLRTLDAAYMDAVSQGLSPRRNATLPVYSQQVERAAGGLLDTIEPLRQAAKFEAESIGHSVNQLIQYFEPLVTNTIGAASNMSNSNQQTLLLDQAKTVTESALQLIYVTKDCGGNPKAASMHPDVDETANSTRDTLQDIINTLESISTQNGIVSGVIETLTRAMSKLADNRASLIMSDDSLSYVDYQTRMVNCAKDIARISSEICTSAVTNNTDKLAPLSAELSHKYSQLSNDTFGACASVANCEVSMKLKEAVQSLGTSCVELVQFAGDCLITKDEAILRDLGESSRTVSEKVSRVLATLQNGSRGTQACINAASTVSGIIGDLETTIMFATAGNLNPENESENFGDHRENILKTAKALVEDTKTLVAGAASTQEQLAVAAQNSVATIVQLAEVVKLGAASLGSDNPDSQVMLINAVRDVATALGDLIHATKAASGKTDPNDPAMAHLKDSAKVMVTNVTSLLKTVKAVEDEHTRGTRALESTIEAIGQEMRTLLSSDGCKPGVTAEDLVRCTKPITNATAKSVAAGISNKQDDIIAAANHSRKSISDMLILCKSAAYNLAETADLREETLNAGHDVAQQFRELLLAILQSGGSSDVKHTLPLISRRIAQSVTELVSAAKRLKGSDWVDPDDPTVIAENELLGAAASIDAAAKKLASLRPRQNIKDPDESMNFDEMILEAAKSIAAATSALVKAASAAQRELIDSGKVSRSTKSSTEEGQWSEGLISAARLVAAATHSLVESANALVQGLGSEDKLIAAAKQVASSTAQLLVACKVKAESDTDATRRLHAAGNAVIRSTDNLVRAAQRSKSVEEERCLVVSTKMVGGIAQEIDARSEVLRIERELEEAKNKLIAIRHLKYKMKGYDTTSGDETDGSVQEAGSRHHPGYDSSTSYSYSSPTKQYHGSYSSLESPNKLNSLERNKSGQHNIIQSHINDLDSNVYGGTGSYGQNQPYSQNYGGSSFNYPQSIYGQTQKVPQSYSKTPQGPQSYTQAPQSYSQSPQSYSQAQTTYGQTTPQPIYGQTAPQPTYGQIAPQPTYGQAAQTVKAPQPTTYGQSSFSTFTQPAPTYGTTSYSTKPSQMFEKPSKPYEQKSKVYETSPNITTKTTYSSSNVSPRPFGQEKKFEYTPMSTNLSTFAPPPMESFVKDVSDGYKTSEFASNTYKTPGGYRTDTYKYESYKSTPQPMYSTSSEKFYTSTPAGRVPPSPIEKQPFETFKNGASNTEVQSSFSSNVEYINEPPVLKDNDSLEQKMLKKSVTQQIIEKKTTTTTKSSKQESSTKSFKLE